MSTFSSDDVLRDLKDFQRASVEHAFRRLYTDADSSGRFLIADETGLGKTMVAKGIIAKTIERLQHDPSIARIDIVYVCSNTDIAEQNLRKLTVTGDHKATPATRLTMLIAQRNLLATTTADGMKPVTFVSFTPATSFDLGWQTGRAEERAVLFLLLQQHLTLKGAEATALKRLLQGGVTSLHNFERSINEMSDQVADGWEPSIHDWFRQSFDQSTLRRDTLELIGHVRGKQALTAQLKPRATELIVGLRRLLAQASVKALEPDLVVLDEFQRFKSLLASGNEAAELAQRLFDQPDARVLLLSATPYKPFTLAEEAQSGDDHYADLIETLRFLARNDDIVTSIERSLRAFREAALAGLVSEPARLHLEDSLRRLLSRVERPGELADHTSTEAPNIEPKDIAGYVALHRIAEAVDAPLTVEYWKSAPYFANFLDGYKVGERLKDALADPARRQELQPLLRKTQRIQRHQVARFEPIEWGNARLRQLAADTVDRDWWKLLWIPPSLPYYQPAGVFGGAHAANVTKRLVFSSWVAAPSAIASLLSYESERRIRSASNHRSRDKFSARLQYRVTEGRAAAMTTLGLFWPSPLLAMATDPLVAARTAQTPLTVDQVQAWAEVNVSSLIPSAANRGDTGSSSAWYWASSFAYGVDRRLADQLVTASDTELGDVLLGSVNDGDENDGDTPRSLTAHLAEARQTLVGDLPDAAYPADLVATLATLGLAAPGNVAWRALARVIPPDSAVTPLGHWRAAALIASGFRAMFNRPEATYLLDVIEHSDDESHWRNVLAYCCDGNLQALVDEYLHHLVGSEGISPTSDKDLLALGQACRRALSIRGVNLQATDVDHPDGGPIRFRGRFALRYGGVRQEQDDDRLPEVRAAFNSPFWPFVLATTSIGQEGVDLHWWCHAIVHWNLPSNPVDFEQREGRVNRFKGHAIRRNVAAAHGRAAIDGGAADVWTSVFNIAEASRGGSTGDMEPYWFAPGDAVIQRSVLGFPMSRDQQAWQRMKDILALYRLAYGQPRQEDMVDLLQRRGVAGADVDSLRLRLAPPATP
jgi:hypothetical protein